MATCLARASRRAREICGLVLLAGCASVLSQPQSFDLVQMCDPQIGFVDYAAEVARFRQAVRQVNELEPDFVLICGDLVEVPSRKSFADFNAAKAAFKVPCYCVPGNHDVGDAPTPESLRFYRQSIGKDYYCFEHKGCAFLVVNTQLWKVPVPEESARQDAWFKETLAGAAKKGRRIFVAGHIPLFARTPEEPNGHDNLPLEKRRELLSLFERYGVQLMLAGHTHRTLFVQYKATQMATSETTSLNVDLRPFGFRLWHINAAPPFRNEFVLIKPQPKSRSATPAHVTGP
ncbi:MAG: metallophosphoesterase [Limisphaerales bacterium]